MKNYRKHIDDFFREKLGRYTETPPADVWDSLDARLDTLTPAVPGTPYKWLWHVGMVSLITVLSISITRKYINDKAAETAAVAPAIEQVATASNAANAVATPSAVQNESAGNNATTTNNCIAGNSTGNSVAGTSQPAAMRNEATRDEAAQSAGSSKNVAVVKQHADALNNKATAKLYAAAGENNAGQAAKNNTSKQYSGAANVAETSEQMQLSPNAAAGAAGGTQAAAPQLNGSPARQNATETIKKDNINKVKQLIATKAASKNATTPGFNRWEAGVKVGYERGFNNIAATKFVVAPYLQYNLSSKVAIMVQPAAKYAKTNTRTLNTSSYYQVNNDGQVNQTGSDMIVKVEGSVIDTYYHSTYHISQSHDSIAKSSTYGGTYTEFEFPILVKYNISDKASVYGGVNIIYSQTTGVKENTYTKKGITRTVDTMLVTNGLPTAPTVSDAINYSGTPYASYNGPLYPSTHENQVRLGGMMGFSYACSKRLLLDALIQHNPAAKDMKGAYNINVPLSSTYFRLSVGYKLTK